MTTPQTVAGAIRAHLAALFPDLAIYRNEAPEGTEAPAVVITDSISIGTENLGEDILLNEQVQVDLYLDYAEVSYLADNIHSALHRAPIQVPGSQIHRVNVIERVTTTTDTGNDTGVERITYTVQVRRRIGISAQGVYPIEPPLTQLQAHEAQTTNVHGIANTVELETQTGAQAKADNALYAANAYTDAAVEGISAPDLSAYETIVGAQAKADAAEADANTYTDDAIAAIPPVDLSAYETIVGAQAKADAAEADANTYTDDAIAAIPPVDLSAYETIVGAQAKADAAEADAIAASNAYTDQEVVELTNGTTDFEAAQFNTTTPGTSGVGRLTWNATDGTLDLGLLGGNVTLQVGQESVQHVNNRTGSAFTDGQVVYVNGSQGNRLTAALALATNDTLSARTFGVVTEPIANNQSGFVTTSGLVRNIDTSALPEGAAIYLSSTVPGGLTATRPLAPNHGVLVGWCVRQHATVGSIFVHVQNGFELGELHNVLTNGTLDGQVLTYEASTSLWKPKTPAGGGSSGGTYQGAWDAGTTYSGNTMVTYNGSMYAATGTPAAGAAPSAFYPTFNSNLTGSDWTRFNVASLASPVITMINNTGNTNSQAYNSTTNLVNLSNRATSTVRVTQAVDLSITGGADGMFVGFFPSTFTPTALSTWWSQTTAMSVFIDIFNNRIALNTNGTVLQTAANAALRTTSSALFDAYRLEWTFTSTNTNVTVYRNNIQLASFTFTQNAGQVSMRDGLAAASGGSTGIFKAQNYTRSNTPIVNTGWQRLYTLP